VPFRISSQPIVSLILPLDDVCREYPGFSRSRLYRLSSEGRIEILKIGNRSMIRRADIEAFIEAAPRLHPRRVEAAA
jgi:excisionase family DNA binding protein